MVHPHDLWYDPWTIRILALARGLQQYGHKIHLCHMPRRDRPAHAPLRSPQDDDPPIYDLLPRQKHFIPNLRRLYSLARDCDIIHLQKCFPASALPVLWTSRRLNKPLHYDWDDHETALARIVEARLFTRLQLAVYERNLPHFADSLTYSSHAIREKALQRDFPKERMFHLPVGADTQRFHPDVDGSSERQTWNIPPHAVIILYLGQLEGASHAYRLIEAAPTIVEQVPQAYFFFAGGGEQLEELREKARISPVAHAIHIAGYISYPRIPSLVAMADICVACFDDDDASRCKSPLKIAEYMASGKPIVASRVGDVPWMINNVGITVPPMDTGSLAQGIITYVQNEKRRFRDAQAARKRALQHFTWQAGVKTLCQAYRMIKKESIQE